MILENIQVDYRSLRIGFCVRDGNIQDIITASQLNTLLWGGIYNPIIPIGAKDNLADDLVKFFQIDVLIPIIDTPEIKNFIKKYEWASFPWTHHSREIITDDSYKTGYKKVSVLDISHILKKIWDEEFKFAPNGKSNCAYVSWKSTDPDANILNLVFGNYPKEKFSFNYLTSYKKALRAKEVKIETKKSLPALLGKMISPILLTEHQIKTYGGNKRGSGIYVGDQKNFYDLINFWNIRASGSYLTFLPKKNSKRFLPYVRTYISRIRKSSELQNKPVIRVWFTGESEADRKEIQAIIKPLENKERIFGIGTMSNIWSNDTASYNLINEASCTASIGAKYGKPTISIQLLDKPFPKREKKFLDQYFAISFRPPLGTDYPEYTASLPVLPDLNEWYAREMVFDPYSLRVIKNYLGKCISIITDIDKDMIEVNPIPKIDIIKRILERASITAEKSGAGLVSERLIALMGGVMGSARVFKIRGVRKFIENTNPLHQKTKYEIEKDIYDNGSFKNFEKEFGLKGNSPLTTDDVFQTLVERNLLQAGVELRCPKCSLKTWINLKEVDATYSCEFCYEKSKFVETIEPIILKCGEEIKKIDGVRWYYRLSGLLGKDDKQQGAIPVILTFLHLGNRMHSGLSGDIIQSTALEFIYAKGSQKEKAETDLFVMDLSERMGKNDIEVLIGECKTGKPITRAQIDRLITARELIQNSGIKCHLIFVKTKGEFTASEIGHFKRLYSQGIKPILFTYHELEKWWNEYKDFEKKKTDFKLPISHPFTFSELAINSAYVYELY